MHMKKRNDQVSKEVALRVGSCNDLVAVEARYHTSCIITFVNPEKTFYHGENKSNGVSGRPTENEKQSHFEQLCEWMEQEAECYTVKELHEKMIELADSPTVYTTKWLKRKMIEKYDQHVFFAEMKGRPDVVCLKNVADLIVNNAWYDMREKGLKKESETIINTAAKLILSDIRSINLENDIYPLENKIADINICESLLPESLRSFWKY